MRLVLASILLALQLPVLAAPDQGEIDALLNRLDQIRQSEGVAGLGLVLVDRDKTLWAGGRGVEDWDSGKPMHAESLIRIGSVTKTVAGLTFLLLDQQGLLPLDAKVSDLVNPPPYDNAWQETHSVTIAQLLEHTAGLGDMVKAEWDHNTPLPLDQALRVAPESRKLRWPPGLHHAYSNTGAGVAAHAMQVHTGLDFEQYSYQHLLKPLGMESASYSLTPWIKDNLVTGYNTDGRSKIPYWHTLYRPFGGINVKLNEMGQFVRLLLGRGSIDGKELLPTSAIERMESPASTLAARSGLEFGYGLGSRHYLSHGAVLHGHGGDADGYLCQFGYSLDSGLGYFLVINAFRGSTLRKMEREVERLITADVSTPSQVGQPQAAGHLRALTGTYETVASRFGRRLQPSVVFEDGRLWLRRGGDREHLVPLSRWHFRRVSEPVATMAFIEHNGEMYLQGGIGNYRRIRR